MQFDKSMYAALWSDEGRRVMNILLQNPELIRPEYNFWATKFLVDPEITPTNQKGEAIFTSSMRQLDAGELMDMRAPLSDTRPADKRGLEFYSDRIPEYSAKGYYEKAMERMYKEDLFDQFGDSSLLAAFAVNELQRMQNSAYQTLSNQSAQLLSTAKIIYNYGEGIQGGVIKAKVPEENFHKAGTTVWADASCKLLDQMREIEDEYRQKWGVTMNMQWEIPVKMYRDVFMKNAQVLEWIKYTNVINNTPLPDGFIATEEMTKRALAQYPDLSPIVIIEEKQKDGIKGIVSGWAEGVAVLRPAGYAGYVRRSTILDEKAFKKYGNSVNSYNFTPAINGLGVFMNSEVVNGNFKEWHTDLFMKAVPTLDEFLYHVIVDTRTAND